MNVKRVAAIVLAATMAMGSTLTVFAEPESQDPAPTSPVTSGSTEGAGENEGHVEKKSINVVLPTMPETGSPFDYITDPERLIQGTEGAKYTDAQFPAKNSDTGVYFKVGVNKYANTSKTLQVINKSSCDVAVTVAIEAEQKSAKDLPLASSAATSKDTPLYLAVNVGSTSHALSSTSTPVKKVIAGNADNFEITYNSEDDEYAYTTKKDAVNWKALQFNVTGAVSEDAVVEDDTTAPTVKVTWSYAEAVEADGNVVAADQVDYIDAPIVEFDYTGAIKISNLKEGQSVTGVSMTFPGEPGVVINLMTNANTSWNGDYTEGAMNSVLTDILKGYVVTLTVTFSDETSQTVATEFSDGPIVSLDNTGLIKIVNLKEGQTVTAVSLVIDDSETVDLLTNQNTTWNPDKTEAQMNSVLTEYMAGKSATVTVTFSDDTTKSATTQF